MSDDQAVAAPQGEAADLSDVVGLDEGSADLAVAGAEPLRPDEAADVEADLADIVGLEDVAAGDPAIDIGDAAGVPSVAAEEAEGPSDVVGLDEAAAADPPSAASGEAEVGLDEAALADPTTGEGGEAAPAEPATVAGGAEPAGDLAEANVPSDIVGLDEAAEEPATLAGVEADAAAPAADVSEAGRLPVPRRVCHMPALTPMGQSWRARAEVPSESVGLDEAAAAAQASEALDEAEAPGETTDVAEASGPSDIATLDEAAPAQPAIEAGGQEPADGSAEAAAAEPVTEADAVGVDEAAEAEPATLAGIEGEAAAPEVDSAEAEVASAIEGTPQAGDEAAEPAVGAEASAPSDIVGVDEPEAAEVQLAGIADDTAAPAADSAEVASAEEDSPQVGGDSVEPVAGAEVRKAPSLATTAPAVAFSLTEGEVPGSVGQQLSSETVEALTLSLSHFDDSKRAAGGNASKARPTWTSMTVMRGVRRARSDSPPQKGRQRSAGSSPTRGSPSVAASSPTQRSMRSDSPALGRRFLGRGVCHLFGPPFGDNQGFAHIYRTPGFGDDSDVDDLSPTHRCESPKRQLEVCSQMMRGLSPNLKGHEEKKSQQEKARIPAVVCVQPKTTRAKRKQERDPSKVFASLHSEAMKRVSKQSELMDAAEARLNEVCTPHKVKIPKNLEKKLEEVRQGVAPHDRLYEDHRKVLDKRKEFADEFEKRERALLKSPELSAATKKIAANFNAKEVRWQDHAQKREEKLLAMVEEKAARESEGQTFRPVITQKSRELSYATPAKRKEFWEKKLDMIKADRDKAELQECTFAPKINANRKHLALARSTESAASHERMHATVRKKQVIAQANAALQQLAEFTKKKGVRLTDALLPRSGTLPLSAELAEIAGADRSAPSVTFTQLAELAGRAGLALPLPGCRALVACLDSEQRGEVTVQRVEVAIRAALRGVMLSCQEQPAAIPEATIRLPGAGPEAQSNEAACAASVADSEATWPTFLSMVSGQASESTSSPKRWSKAQATEKFSRMEMCPQCGVPVLVDDVVRHRVDHVNKRKLVQYDSSTGRTTSKVDIGGQVDGISGFTFGRKAEQVIRALGEVVQLHAVLGGPVTVVRTQVDVPTSPNFVVDTSRSRKNLVMPTAAHVVLMLESLGIPSDDLQERTEIAAVDSIYWELPRLPEEAVGSPKTSGRRSQARGSFEEDDAPSMFAFRKGQAKRRESLWSTLTMGQAASELKPPVTVEDILTRMVVADSEESSPTRSRGTPSPSTAWSSLFSPPSRKRSSLDSGSARFGFSN